MNENRYRRLIREANDALGLLEDEHRTLSRSYANVVSENKRLRFSQCGEQPKELTFGDLLTDRRNRMDTESSPYVGVSKLEQAYPRRELRTKANTYFDVVKWLWVAEAVIPYSVNK